MKDLIYLDANFLTSYILEDHVFHERALAIYEKIKNSKLAISYLTLDELIYSISKYSNQKDLVKNIVSEFLLNGNILIVGLSNDCISADNYLHLWNVSNLRSRDAMHIAIMKENQINKIVTFDTDFIKQKESLYIKIVE